MRLVRRVGPIRPSPPHVPTRHLLVGAVAAKGIVMYVSLFSVFTGYVTTQYPPGYFRLPWAWGSAFVAAGALGALVVLVPRWPTLTLWAGAAMAGLAVARGLFIGTSLPWEAWWAALVPDDRLVDGQSASFVIASFQWVTCGMMLFVSWPALIHDTGVAHTEVA